MAEYIDRAVAEEILRNRYERLAGLRPDFYGGFSAARKILELETPNAADVVEVVRCRDCKYYKINPYGEESERMCKCWGDYLPTNADDFCSYGERKPD